MTLPRQVLPGRFYLITRSCTQQQYLLRPDDVVNNAWIYCLGLCSTKHEIHVIGTSVQSNHHHTVIYDPHGNYPAFLAHFHNLTSRFYNTLRGRTQCFWSSEQVSVVRLEDIDAVLKYLVYTFVNPVRHRLVATIEEWTGVNTHDALVNDRVLVAKRPHLFFSDNSPETIALRMSVPDKLGKRATFIAALQRRVKQKLVELADERKRKGLGVMLRKTLAKMTWRQHPRRLRRITKGNQALPKRTFAIKGGLRQVEIAQRRRTFLADYAIARANWIAGAECAFPEGSYFMGRFTCAPIKEPDGTPTWPEPLEVEATEGTN